MKESIFDSRSEEIEKQIISASFCSSTVETRWDWRLGLQIYELHSLKIIHNYTTPASRFNTLFVYDRECNKARPHPLDELNQLLIEIFNTPMTYEEALEKALLYFELDTEDATMAVHRLVRLRVTDLLKAGALTYTNERKP